MEGVEGGQAYKRFTTSALPRTSSTQPILPHYTTQLPSHYEALRWMLRLVQLRYLRQYVSPANLEKIHGDLRYSLQLLRLPQVGTPRKFSYPVSKASAAYHVPG